MARGAFDYSKWDNIELSDDEEDFHPNIDKDSWIRLKHRTHVEQDEDDGKKRAVLEEKQAKLMEELKVYGEAGKEHTKAKKLQQEIDKIQEQLDKMFKATKWTANNMCKTSESRSLVSDTSAPTPAPEPRLVGEEATAGYCEFVEQHEELLEKYIALGADDDFEVVMEFLKVNGGTLLQGEHAETYLLLDCLEKEMNGEHFEMTKSARQNQFLTQLREFSRASHRPVRDAVHPIFTKLLEHEPTREAFDEAVADFIKRIEKRAVVKKKEMDAEMAKEDGPLNQPGPGGLDPIEVLHTLPHDMRSAFEAQDMQRLQRAIEALPEDEAKYHLRRCEDSGLWVPNPDYGQAPYRQ